MDLGHQVAKKRPSAGNGEAHFGKPRPNKGPGVNQKTETLFLSKSTHVEDGIPTRTTSLCQNF